LLAQSSEVWRRLSQRFDLLFECNHRRVQRAKGRQGVGELRFAFGQLAPPLLLERANLSANRFKRSRSLVVGCFDRGR
jgi:hypothetical protein